MSTRANIVIKHNNHKVYLYHHHDGYLEGVGADLLHIIDQRCDEMMDCESVERIILEHNSDGNTYEKTDCIHSDIEYLYTIELRDAISTREMRMPAQLVLTAEAFSFYDFSADAEFPRVKEGYGKRLPYGCQWFQDFQLGTQRLQPEESKGKSLEEATFEELFAELKKRCQK